PLNGTCTRGAGESCPPSHRRSPGGCRRCATPTTKCSATAPYEAATAELERVLVGASTVAAMGMPTDVPIIDTMIGFPSADRREVYKFLAPSLRDAESIEDFKMPAQYMFKDIPDDIDEGVDPV